MGCSIGWTLGWSRQATSNEIMPYNMRRPTQKAPCVAITYQLRKPCTVLGEITSLCIGMTWDTRISAELNNSLGSRAMTTPLLLSRAAATLHAAGHSAYVQWSLSQRIGAPPYSQRPSRGVNSISLLELFVTLSPTSHFPPHAPGGLKLVSSPPSHCFISRLPLVVDTDRWPLRRLADLKAMCILPPSRIHVRTEKNLFSITLQQLLTNRMQFRPGDDQRTPRGGSPKNI